MLLPPNQQLAAPGRWPVVGEREPRHDDSPWTVSVSGLVRHERNWTLDEILAMPQVDRVIDIHCVTRWSRLWVRFRGVTLAQLLSHCQPLPEARYLSLVARSARSHSTSLPIQDALELDALVALTHEGEPIESIHGGPVRMVVPGRYFYKSLKWLERIEVLPEDRLGYWEAEAGYHNTADPWREERYIAPNLNRRELHAALQQRDFSGRDFRSLDARGRDLHGLNARGALLRDADFRGADLRGACFDRANLSNAHLQGSDLRGASFVSADVEGADFRGADLREAILTGAFLTGATFIGEGAAPVGEYPPAQVDATTSLEVSEALTPAQQEFLRARLAR